jgi:hypothetical protein
MDKESVIQLLKELNTRVGALGIHAELFIVGGAAMALEFDSQRTTSDIDAIIEPRNAVLSEATNMAAEYGLPTDWLNDSVASLMPSNPDERPISVAELGNITVTAGSPEFILAMKAMVKRQSAQDLADAARLCVHLGIYDEHQIEKVIRKYIGPGALGARELWLEDIAVTAQKFRADELVVFPSYTRPDQYLTPTSGSLWRRPQNELPSTNPEYITHQDPSKTIPESRRHTKTESLPEPRTPNIYHAYPDTPSMSPVWTEVLPNENGGSTIS